METDAEFDSRSTAAGTSRNSGDHHRDVSGGWLRAGVFGATDGLVTNASLIAGVGGGGGAHQTIVLTGMAGLVAGAFSMATGEYISVTTQNEAIGAEIAVEKKALDNEREAEIAELAGAYIARGVSRDTAVAFATELADCPEQALQVHVQEELGVDAQKLPGAWTAAISSFVSFALGALLPLLPYLLGFTSLPASLIIAAASLTAAGALAARFTSRSAVFSGLRQVLLGGLAIGATYLIGYMLGANA
jgi:vacuolar iron transporter family protein